ncbi:phage portal protein, partial [Mycolicibacillus trivialis]
MSSDLLVEMLQTLDGPQHRYTELDRYATGQQALAFLSPEARIALPALNRIVSNIPGLAVTSLAERLKVTGFKDVDVWGDWLANDLDQQAPILHREALTFGDAYVIVWARPDGSPLVTVESPQQVAVIKDPATREVVSAVKRWRTKTETHAMLYLPDRLEHWRAKTAGAATAGYELIAKLDNPLGVVPVVNFCNAARILGAGRSEIDDLIPLVNGLNATLAGLAVAQEFTARPRRWATGIELAERPVLDGNGEPVLDGDGQPVMETVNPIPEGNRAMLSENDQAKFGQLPGADLAGYEAACRIWLQQIMAVSALPAHMVGITTENPSSAEALRASEASLTARAEARQAVFGRSWEQVARLMVAIRDRVDPASVDPTVLWRDPSSSSTG